MLFEDSVEAILEHWPETARELADRLTQQYGPPDEASAERLLWRSAGEWKRLAVHREGPRHAWPHPHTDHVEGVIDHAVPLERVQDILAFHGSITVARTAGELACRCKGEEEIRMALNIANDLVEGHVDAAAARRAYVERLQTLGQEAGDPLMHRLTFRPRYHPEPDEESR